MRFMQARLQGVYIIESEVHQDDRGSFVRTYSRDEFAREGLPVDFVQCNVSFNRKRATLRGMHYQASPYPEGKLVYCTRGAIYDIIVDLRPASLTYCQWLGLELSEQNAHALYIPPGFAHGFQTLCDSAQVVYHMTEAYRAELARGVRWNDPTFRISWPLAHPTMSGRDASFPDFLPGACDQGIA
jgi:dTDP-4-dehydrorhamnose 3,5-epimerase